MLYFQPSKMKLVKVNRLNFFCFSEVLDPCVKMCFIQFWSEMYHANRSNKINEAIERLVQENKSLEQTVQMLEEAINGQ